jgi:hypothetical protein
MISEAKYSDLKTLLSHMKGRILNVQYDRVIAHLRHQYDLGEPEIRDTLVLLAEVAGVPKALLRKDQTTRQVFDKLAFRLTQEEEMRLPISVPTATDRGVNVVSKKAKRIERLQLTAQDRKELSSLVVSKRGPVPLTESSPMEIEINESPEPADYVLTEIIRAVNKKHDFPDADILALWYVANPRDQKSIRAEIESWAQDGQFKMEFLKEHVPGSENLIQEYRKRESELVHSLQIMAFFETPKSAETVFQLNKLFAKPYVKECLRILYQKNMVKQEGLAFQVWSLANPGAEHDWKRDQWIRRIQEQNLALDQALRYTKCMNTEK